MKILFQKSALLHLVQLIKIEAGREKWKGEAKEKVEAHTHTMMMNKKKKSNG
jgi:hypothetical protein